MRKLVSIVVVIVAIVVVYNYIMPEDPGIAISSTAITTKSSDQILLVNKFNLLDKNYVPENLVNLYSFSNNSFELARSNIELCDVAYQAMQKMFSQAKKDGVSGFIISSGYRSSAYQAELYKNNNDGTVAKPGTSEHETGLAFDVTTKNKTNGENAASFENTAQFRWLKEHCGEYGFIIRYPKSKEENTGYPYEPWHYRYVGLPFSQEIMDSGLSLEEYLAQ